MGRNRLRLRGMPVALVVGSLLLTLKLGSIWQGVATLDARKLAFTAAHAEGGGNPATKDKGSAQVHPQGGHASQDAAPAGAGGPAASTQTAADALPPTFSNAEVEVLQQLKQRREALDARELEIVRREDLMKAAESKIDQRVDQLKALQASIERLLQTHDERQEAKLRSLVKIYENMKPKDAARIFEELDLETLLSVVERMNERKLSPILAEMKPTKAKDVTVELARLKELFGAGNRPAGEGSRPVPATNG